MKKNKCKYIDYDNIEENTPCCNLLGIACRGYSQCDDHEDEIERNYYEEACLILNPNNDLKIKYLPCSQHLKALWDKIEEIEKERDYYKFRAEGVKE